MRIRASTILIEQDQIALIERHKAGRHYFTIPGGGVDEKETPQEAAIREMEEETGLQVRILRLVAEIWFRGNQQFYYLVEKTGGVFGSGQGEEMQAPQPLNPLVGTYKPLWMAVEDIPDQPLLPKEIAELILRSYRSGWPEDILVVKESEIA